VTQVTTTSAPAQRLALLGLFPAWDPGPIGGVQRSGREAWEAILQHTGSDAAHALCYAPRSSKTRAVLRAMKVITPPQTVLVWHLDLLKLLPFLDLSHSRVALFVHGIEAWRQHDWITERLFRRVDLFLSNTDHTWQTFLQHYPAAAAVPHATVHLGLESALESSGPGPAAVPAALMLSRLDATQNYKGHRQMLAAWPEVLTHMPAAQLWIAGGGDLRPQLERLVAQAGLSGSVRFFGEISDADKGRLLADCRCFAMPSRGDGFGLVYLEAMRVGRPCLVSTIDSGREVVNPPEAGLAVNPESTSAVCEAVVRLMTGGPEWDKWSLQARQRYESHFTLRHFRARLQHALFET
jgi:phosphatidyl-myo-inositol dimannoside synthase